MQDVSLNQFQYAEAVGSTKQHFVADAQRTHALNVPSVVSSRDHGYALNSPYYESLGSNPYLAEPAQSERIIGSQVASSARQQSDIRRATYTSETEISEHKTHLTGGSKVIENKYGLGVRLVDKTPRNSNSNMNNPASSRQHLGSEEFKGLEYKVVDNRVYTPIKSQGTLVDDAKKTKLDANHFGQLHSPQAFGAVIRETNYANSGAAAVLNKGTKSGMTTEAISGSTHRIVTATPSAAKNSQKQLLQMRSPTQSVRFVGESNNAPVNVTEQHSSDEVRTTHSQRVIVVQQGPGTAVGNEKTVVQEQKFAQGSYQQLPTQIVQVQPGQVRQHIQTIVNQSAQPVAEVSQWKQQAASTQQSGQLQTPTFTPALLQSPQQTVTQLANLASPKHALQSAKEAFAVSEQQLSQRLSQLSQLSGEIVKIELEGVGTYEGVVRNNTMHGFGKLIDIRGRTVYEGEFSNNQFEGLGVLYNYEESQSHVEARQGSFVPENWIRYEGMFHDSKKNGNGYLFYANGGRFAGEFVNDSASGSGVLVQSTGDVVRGMWREGRLAAQY